MAERTADLDLYRNYLWTFLNNLPMLAWLKDYEGRFLMVNQLFAEAVGRSWQEIIGLTDLDVWPRELAEAYRADDRAVMASRTRKQVEECIEAARGGGWFETFKSPLIDSGGIVIGTAGNARDITERMQAFETLKELEARYRIVADNTYDWEYWLNPDKTSFVYVSPSCKRITGYDAAEFLNDPELFPASSIPMTGIWSTITLRKGNWINGRTRWNSAYSVPTVQCGGSVTPASRFSETTAFSGNPRQQPRHHRSQTGGRGAAEGL